MTNKIIIVIIIIIIIVIIIIIAVVVIIGRICFSRDSLGSRSNHDPLALT